MFVICLVSCMYVCVVLSFIVYLSVSLCVCFVWFSCVSVCSYICMMHLYSRLGFIRCISCYVLLFVFSYVCMLVGCVFECVCVLVCFVCFISVACSILV